MPQLDVLVVGATGQEGGAVAHALLRGGHNVRALTRDLTHPQADVLRRRGARLAWANLDEPERLRDAAVGVDAIFAVTTTDGAGPAGETRRGLTLIELAQALGTRHLVYLSTLGAAQYVDMLRGSGRHEVEQALQTLDVPHTIVAPAFFMENYLRGRWLAGLQQGVLSMPLPAGRKLQQVAMADVGRFVRLILERRDEFLGHRVGIASDELTPVETAATLARILGQRVQYEPPSPESLRGEDAGVATLFQWLERQGGSADVMALREAYPEVNWHTLDGWAVRQDWDALIRAPSA